MHLDWESDYPDKSIAQTWQLYFCSKLTDVWPKGVFATVVLLLSLCFFSEGIVKQQRMPMLAWGCLSHPFNSLGVLSAYKPLTKGHTPHHVASHEFTFAQKLLKVAGRKDGPVAKS